MPWFSKSGKEKEKKLLGDNLWVKCGRCGAHVFKEEWAHTHKVCPKCNYHGKLTAYERISLTIDSGTFTEMFASITPSDPLSFVDGKGAYPAKVDEARAKTKLNESVVTGAGRINGIPVSIAVMDFRFLGGSLGSGTGEKILRASNYAFEKEVPFIIFSASGGARMQEGALVAHADGQDLCRHLPAQPQENPLHLGAHRPDNRWCLVQFCHGGRRQHRGTRRGDRVCWTPRDRADDQPEAAR